MSNAITAQAASFVLIAKGFTLKKHYVNDQALEERISEILEQVDDHLTPNLTATELIPYFKMSDFELERITQPQTR